jgi:hypothetical protein
MIVIVKANRPTRSETFDCKSSVLAQMIRRFPRVIERVIASLRSVAMNEMVSCRHKKHLGNPGKEILKHWERGGCFTN